MPILKNVRHELACLYRLQGYTQQDAYELAGYSRNAQQACKLFNRDEVKARIAELMEQRAEEVVKRREVTRDSITDEMDENRRHALEQGQIGPAVTQTTQKAKLYNLFPNDRIEHTGADGEPLEIVVNFVRADEDAD